MSSRTALRTIIIACPVLGVALVVAGTHGDSVDWWVERPFLTNLYSTVTTTMFGIPFVLSVLEFLRRRAAEEEAVKLAETHLRTVLEHVSDVSDRLWPETAAMTRIAGGVRADTEMLRRWPGRLDVATDRLRDAWQQFESAYRHIPRYRDTTHRLGRCSDHIADVVSEARAYTRGAEESGKTVETKLRRAFDELNVLATDLRQRR